MLYLNYSLAFRCLALVSHCQADTMKEWQRRWEGAMGQRPTESLDKDGDTCGRRYNATASSAGTGRLFFHPILGALCGKTARFFHTNTHVSSVTHWLSNIAHAHMWPHPFFPSTKTLIAGVAFSGAARAGWESPLNMCAWGRERMRKGIP